jgi:3-methyladenine DNA glycosylase AlkD
MYTTDEIMSQLKGFGDENIKKILVKHGVKEPFFGVKVEHLKAIQKKVKKDQQLAKDLYATGNADAMYLAGLIADDKQFTKAELQTWAEQAVSNNINEYTVPWVTAESRYGLELALEWIDSPAEHIAAAGWSTLGGLTALLPDSELDLPLYKKLLKRVEENIHHAPNRVRLKMNNFVINVGSYVVPLNDEALATAAKIGVIEVDMNGTACKVPDPAAYIQKVKDKGTQGKKKKTLMC